MNHDSHVAMVYRRTEKTVRRLAQRHGAIIAAARASAAEGGMAAVQVAPVAAEFQTRIERAIRGGHLPAQNAHLSAAAAVGALLESLIGPLASATAEGELEPVEALMLYVLRGLGIPDARARGLVVSRTRENGGETAAQV